MGIQMLFFAFLISLLVSARYRTQTRTSRFYDLFERTSVIVSQDKLMFEFHSANQKHKLLKIEVLGKTIHSKPSINTFIIDKVHYIIPKGVKTQWIKCYSNDYGNPRTEISFLNQIVHFDSHTKFCRFVAPGHSAVAKIEHLINHYNFEYEIKDDSDNRFGKELIIKTCHDSLASRIHPKIKNISILTGDRVIVAMENGQSFEGYMKDGIFFIKGVLTKDYNIDKNVTELDSLISYDYNHYQQIHRLKSPISIVKVRNRQQMGSYHLGLHRSFHISNDGVSLLAKVHGHFNLEFKQDGYTAASINQTKIRINHNKNLIRMKLHNLVVILKIGEYNKIKYRCWYKELVEHDFDYLEKEIIKDDGVINYQRSIHCRDLEPGVLDELEIYKWKYIKKEIKNGIERWVIYFKTKNYSKMKIDKMITM